MDNSATSFIDSCTASTRKLREQLFINKIWNRSLINPYLIWRSSFQNMFTCCCNCYVTFLVANNTFWNNFMYLQGRNYQNNFGQSLLMEMVFPLRLSYFHLKNLWKFEFFMTAREISKSDFFAIFCKLLYEAWTENWIKSTAEILPPYKQQLRKFSFRQYFPSLGVNCPFVFGSYHLAEVGLYLCSTTNGWIISNF